MIPRLYINAPLEPGARISLTQPQAHYLKNVLRREAGGELRLFNGRDGEFAAQIVTLKKKSGLAAVKAKTREQENEPDLQLLFAPVKRGALETIVQKATEIGAARLTPVMTDRTDVSKVNAARLQAIAVEAAEQCGRLTVPHVDEPVKFTVMLESWPEGRRLVYCDEAGDEESEEWGGRGGRAAPVLEALKDIGSDAQQWAILIGPEGGFAPQERAALRAKSFVTPVTLGPRILRADTAAIAALVLWQAARGDWRRS